jgi:PEGA domain-containing protein
MNIRLLGLALAAIYMIGTPSLASAQHRGRSRGHVAGGSVVQVGPGVIGPRVIGPGSTRLVFARPYYTFRPFTQLRPGLFLGFSVPYPNRYFYSTAYPYSSYYPYYYYAPPVYPYIPPLTYMTYGSPYSVVIPNATPSASASTAAVNSPGGVSFEVTPDEAAVFVDGVYVGKASDFTPSTSPLSLVAGRHRFELRALGYQSMDFDVQVVAGEVVPYQATLQPQR